MPDVMFMLHAKNYFHQWRAKIDFNSFSRFQKKQLLNKRNIYRLNMSDNLREYLLENYLQHNFKPVEKIRKDYHIQIDDQDDNDSITTFCNVFITVSRGNIMEFEICGGIPITRDLADFAEIYGGMADTVKNRLVLYIKPGQIEALLDLALRIKKTASLGYVVQNTEWEKISSRTVSSIYRFVRIIKDYRKLKKSGFL